MGEKKNRIWQKIIKILSLLAKHLGKMGIQKDQAPLSVRVILAPNYY